MVITPTAPMFAAIMRSLRAALYGLEVLEPNIQDSDNYTRFVVISREPRVYPGANRASLMISAGQQARKTLSPRARALLYSTSTSSSSSRPIPGHDFLRFMFYFDLDCPFGGKGPSTTCSTPSTT